MLTTTLPQIPLGATGLPVVQAGIYGEAAPRVLKQDLCYAALSFASDTLKSGGHFVCKFYQGTEDKALEHLLRKMFVTVKRVKPDASRSV